MKPDPRVNQEELNKIVRQMQNASDDKAKQTPLYNQKAADVIKQGAADKRKK